MGCTSNRVRFLCLGDTKKPEPKKSHSLLLFEQIVGLTYNPTQPHRTESHHHSVQSFAADLRTQPRLFRRSGLRVRLGLELLPFTIQHLASAGNSKIFAMRRFWSRNLRLDKLGVNHRYLSIRCHALRRGLALAADKTPFLPRRGIPSFVKKEAKGTYTRAGRQASGCRCGVVRRYFPEAVFAASGNSTLRRNAARER